MLKFHYVSARQQAARIFVFLVHFFKQFLQTLENALGVSLATINCLRHSWRRNRVESSYRWHFSVLFLMKMKIGFEKHFLMPPFSPGLLFLHNQNMFSRRSSGKAFSFSFYFSNDELSENFKIDSIEQGASERANTTRNMWVADSQNEIFLLIWSVCFPLSVLNSIVPAPTSKPSKLRQNTKCHPQDIFFRFFRRPNHNYFLRLAVPWKINCRTRT